MMTANTPVSDEDLAETINWASGREKACAMHPDLTHNVERYADIVNMLTELQSRRATQLTDEWCIDMAKAIPLLYDIQSRRSAPSANDVETVRVAIRDEWRGGCARVCRIENASNNLECACHDLAALTARALAPKGTQ